LLHSGTTPPNTEEEEEEEREEEGRGCPEGLLATTAHIGAMQRRACKPISKRGERDSLIIMARRLLLTRRAAYSLEAWQTLARA
jgi:hypothetical protein